MLGSLPLVPNSKSAGHTNKSLEPLAYFKRMHPFVKTSLPLANTLMVSASGTCFGKNISEPDAEVVVLVEPGAEVVVGAGVRLVVEFSAAELPMDSSEEGLPPHAAVTSATTTNTSNTIFTAYKRLTLRIPGDNIYFRIYSFHVPIHATHGSSLCL